MQLISLDLDGTSLEYTPNMTMDKNVLSALRRSALKGVQWVMNSDRTADTMIDLAHSLYVIDRPLAILSTQRYMYYRNSKGGYDADKSWNEKMEECQKSLWAKLSPNFDTWESIIKDRVNVHNSYINEEALAFQVSLRERSILREYLENALAPFPEAELQTNHEWCYVVHREFSKGRVLKRIADSLKITRENILAIGDGRNDLSMLNGTVAELVGCPSNACDDVKATIRHAEGHIANGEIGKGTAEIILKFLTSKNT